MNQTLMIAMIAVLAGLSTTGFVWFGLGLVERVTHDLGVWRAARKAAAAAAKSEAARADEDEERG